MTFLMLILLPCAVAAGCFVVRPSLRLGIQAALATLVVEFIFLLRLPLDEPVRSLGFALAISSADKVLIAALLLAVCSTYVAWTSLPVGESTPASLLVMLGLLIGALLLQSTVPALLLFLAGAGVAILLLVDTPAYQRSLLQPRTIAASVIRLVLLMVGALLLVMGYTLLPSSGAASFSTTVMWLGMLVLAGLLPFQFTLAGLAEDISPHTFLGVVVVPQAVVLALFERILRTQPPATGGTVHLLVLLVVGISVIGMPLLARGTVRHAMAFVLLANVAQIVFGMALGISAASGGMSLLSAHVLGATLLCSSLALLEVHVPGQRDTVTPWRDRPIAAAGLIAGLLMLVGLPGTGGFASKLLLWQFAWRDGALAFGILVVGTVLLVLAGVQIVRTMLFASAEQREADRREHWRRRVAPVHGSTNDVNTLPVALPTYVPLMLRSWTVLLIVIAVVTAIDTFLPG